MLAAAVVPAAVVLVALCLLVVGCSPMLLIAALFLLCWVVFPKAAVLHNRFFGVEKLDACSLFSPVV